MLEIVNKHTLVVQSPDGKTKWININDANPISAKAATDNALQDFKQEAMKKEHTHITWKAQLSKYKMKPHPKDILEKPRKW